MCGCHNIMSNRSHEMLFLSSNYIEVQVKLYDLYLLVYYKSC